MGGGVIALTATAQEQRTADRLGIGLALLAVYLVWGSTYLAMKIGLEGFPPFLLAGIRFVLAGGGMLLVLRARGEPLPTRAQWGGAAIVGALLLVGGNGGVMFAEHSGVSSGLAALGIATVPLWMSLFAGFWGEWPYRGEWLGLAVGFVGIVCLNLEGGLRASPVGAISLGISAVSWALGSIWSRRLPLPGGLTAAGAQMLCGGVLLLVVGGVTGEHLRALPHERPALALVYLVFGAIVGYSAYVYLLPRVRPALSASYAYVNPVIAVLLGAAILGEQLSRTGLMALLLILLGVGLTAFARAPKAVFREQT